VVESEMNLDALRRWRSMHWAQYPMVERFEEIQGLLTHAPRAGMSLMEVHGKPAKERIDGVIAACTQALRDRPDLGRRLRQVVPLLAQEKLTRAGYDPRQIEVYTAAVRAQSSAARSQAANQEM